MKKSDFISLVIGVVATLLLGLGMCMWSLPEWGAFVPGVILTGIGFLSLCILILVRCVKSGKKVRVNWKLTGKILFGTLGALVLGVGMCMITVWDMMLMGILVGIVGIVLLLMLIPMCVGLK